MKDVTKLQSGPEDSKASGMVELLDPDARAADKRRRRLADSEALQAGKVSARALHERNALKVDEIAFELPRLE